MLPQSLDFQPSLRTRHGSPGNTDLFLVTSQRLSSGSTWVLQYGHEHYVFPIRTYIHSHGGFSIVMLDCQRGTARSGENHSAVVSLRRRRARKSHPRLHRKALAAGSNVWFFGPESEVLDHEILEFNERR